MLSALSDGQIAALMALIALVGGGIGFFIKRWISQSGTHERTALLNSLADLRAKMKSENLDFHQIAELERMVRGQVTISSESAEAVTGEDAVDEEPAAYQTTAAMRGRAAARYAVVDAQLEEALMDLMILTSPEEASELDKSHVAWKVYRKRQINYADCRFPGGTIGPLYGTLHGIDVSERRIAEIRQEIETRKSEPM